MPKKISINFEVNAEESGKRIDVIVSKRHPEFSRMQIKKFIELDFLSIDNQTISKVSEKASIGSKINLSGLIDAEVEDLPEDIEIEIKKQTKDFIVINKAPGIVVHPGSGNRSGTILNSLLFNFPELADLPRAGIIHRLDKDTSGCQIVSKKQSFLRKCNEEIRLGKSFKEYLVIVHGEWPSERKEISSYLIKTKNSRGENYVKENEDGKKSVSKFKVIKHSKNITKLSCNIITGRTHQIRVHCSSVGNFVIGDVKYGNRELSKFYKHFGRMFLHSHRLEIPGLSLSICAEEPESFKKILKFDETL